MSAVNIIVLPGKYKARKLTSVSFLGPILEKTALEIMLVNKPTAITTKYQHNLQYAYSFDRRGRLLLEDVAGDGAKEYISTYAEDSISKAVGISLYRDKEIPNIVKETEKHHTHPSFRNLGEISGPIAKREVIYKPGKPRLPSWIAASMPFVLEFEFSVSAHGEVEEVVPLVSSGNPEVDLLGIRYIKSWRFAPLIQTARQEQRGRIRFVFNETESSEAKQP